MKTLHSTAQETSVIDQEAKLGKTTSRWNFACLLLKHMPCFLTFSLSIQNTITIDLSITFYLY